MRGARVSGAAGDEEIRAGAVLLATGGFQGDAGLVRRLIGEGAEHMPVRANPNSVGDGLRMGQAAGAAPSGALDSFYGHMLPSPLERLEPKDYLPLTQYHSHACVVVNRFGRRFADESRGDEVTNQALLRQAGSRGVLFCDERVRMEHAVGPPYPHGQVVDRFEAARVSGARVATADSLDELVALVDGWGVNAGRLRQTLADVEAAAGGSPPPPDDVAIAGWPPPLSEAPFHAVEVQPAITFTFGGLRGDTDGRALYRDGEPVAGLYVAGADLGGLQETGYVEGSCSASSSARARRTPRWALVSGAPRRSHVADRDPDVLIIGAGASGAVAAKRLVEQGFDVVCLEQGDWPDYTLARAAEPDYELTAGRETGTGTRTCGRRRPTIRSTTPIPTSPRSCGTASGAEPWFTRHTGSGTCHPTSGSARSTASPTTGP